LWFYRADLAANNLSIGAKRDVAKHHRSNQVLLALLDSAPAPKWCALLTPCLPGIFCPTARLQQVAANRAFVIDFAKQDGSL
jgi:hypothetical protein